MAKLSTDQLIDAFKELSLIELSDFVKKFEEVFEVTAAAPVAVAAAPAAGGGAGEAAEVRVRRGFPLGGRYGALQLLGRHRRAPHAATERHPGRCEARGADADAQKANLAIQGIQAQLSEVTADGNTLWRVRVGPYSSPEESNPVRDKLSSMGIKPTLIKSSKS